MTQLSHVDLFSGIAIIPSLPAGSASGLAVRGTSGKVSRPFQEWCFLPNARHHSGDAQACGRCLIPACRRRTGRPSKRADTVYEIALGSRQGRPSRAIRHGTRPFSPSRLVVSPRTLTATRVHSLPNTHLSNATDCSRPGPQEQRTPSHTACRNAPGPATGQHPSFSCHAY